MMADSKEQPIRRVEDIHGFFRTGTVRGVGNWSETHVSSSSSGGGGYIHNGSGHVSAPTVTVSSSSTEVIRFFMEYGDEDEEEVTLKGGGFAAREGQRVSVIRIGSRPGWGYNVAYYNHNTGITYSPDYRLEWPLDKRPSRAMLLVGPILGAIVGALLVTGLWLILATGIFAWVFYNYRQKMGEYKRLKEAVRIRSLAVLEDAKAAHSRARAPVIEDVA